MKTKERAQLPGFSLVEYVVIFSVLIVLGTVITFLFHPIDKVQIYMDDKKKADLKLVQQGLENYYLEYGTYPLNTVEYRIANGLGGVQWGAAWDDRYIKSLPIDTNILKSYAYYSNGTSYYLYASLEQGGNDKSACRVDGGSCDSIKENGIRSDACGQYALCNYSITSKDVL